MSRFTAWIALLILIGSVWSQKESSEEGSSEEESSEEEFSVEELSEEELLEEEIDEHLARFGFDLFDPIRKSFCDSSCVSSDTMPYLMNLACAIKCPELYLPQGSSSSTMKSSDKPSTEPPSTTPSTSSTSSSSSKAPEAPTMPTQKP